MENQSSTTDPSGDLQVQGKATRPILEAIVTGVLCLIAIGVSIFYVHNRALLALKDEIKEGQRLYQTRLSAEAGVEKDYYRQAFNDFVAGQKARYLKTDSTGEG